MCLIHAFPLGYVPQPTASEDSTISLSPSKAKELSMKEGDVIVVIGRRRRAAYARVHIHKQKTATSCTVAENLAANLRLRTGDTIKVSSLTSVDDEEHKTGDMILFRSSPKPVTSVTYSPVEDSLQNLEASEGELSDEEITERFVAPYLNLEASESCILVKKGHVVKMTDDNGKHLEFMVTHVELEGAEIGEDEEEGTNTYECISTLLHRMAAKNFIMDLRR
jgi:formylmethanofuran dehydrogenase subunit D